MSVLILSEQALIFSLKSSLPLVVSERSFSPPFPYFRLKLLIFSFIRPLFPLAWWLRFEDEHSFAAAFSLFQGLRQCPPRLGANNEGTKNIQWARLPVHSGRNHQVQEAKPRSKLYVHLLLIKTQLKTFALCSSRSEGKHSHTLLLFKCILIHIRQ